MEELKVTSIKNNGFRIEIKYEMTKGLKKYFNSSVPYFWVEYSEEIADVPAGISVIPFVANVLPFIWITDSCLVLPEIDKSFYDSLPQIRQAYKNMYTNVTFGGMVKSDNIIEHKQSTKGKAAFFSGGVDAFATLVSHAEEKPLLMTIWGADIKLNDETGWKNVSSHIESVAKDFKLPPPISIKSNFREFISERNLEHIVKKSGDHYWHGFQHGIGIISHAAPVAWSHQLETVYIASSYPPEVGNIKCASHPTIDNQVRFSSTKVWHDQYELNRQKKIRKIVDYCKKGSTINLRVCWQSSGGRNCCHCEKCLRTMFGIMAYNEDPRKYGFNYQESDIKASEKVIKSTIYDFPHLLWDWRFIQKEYQTTHAHEQDIDINWIYTLSLTNYDILLFKIKKTPVKVLRKLHIVK